MSTDPKLSSREAVYCGLADGRRLTNGADPLAGSAKANEGHRLKMMKLR